MMSRRLAVALALGLVVAGCGSSSSSSGGSSGAASSGSGPPGTWTGLGARLSAFQAAYPKGTSGCTTGCYGPRVGIKGQLVYEFTTVMTSGPPDNHVTGFTLALPDKTPVSAAKAMVLKLMPSDTKEIS